MLTINLDCTYAEFRLTVNQKLPINKIIGLFGTSGCGKSRFIRQLLGFDLNDQIDAQINFDETVWQNSNDSSYLETHNRGIGYLPQTIDLFPHLTVEQNLLFAQPTLNSIDSIAKAGPNDLDLKRIISCLDIQSITSKYPHQLSGGQKQRVGLARAIVAAKNLLVLDEPLSSVGEDHKPKILQLLQQLNREKGLTIIFSSHNRYEHAYLTEHLVTMKDGQVEQSGEYHLIASDISQAFAQEPDAINNISAIAECYEENHSVNNLRINEHILWAGHSPIEPQTHVSLEVRAKDISISLKPLSESSMLNCLETILVEAIEISHHQYLLKLKFEQSYLVAFITKKSFVELNLETGLKNQIKLYASFKAVSVISI
jgi:molybdate transport system ATP-binding protein